MSRLALPHVTLLAALCGGAAAQTIATPAPAPTDAPARSLTAAELSPSELGMDAGTGRHQPFGPDAGASPTMSAAPATTVLRLRKASSARRSTPFTASELAMLRAHPMGGLLSRVSGPAAWLAAPVAETGHTRQPGTAGQASTVMGLDQVLGRSDRALETVDTTLAGGTQFTRTRTRRIDTSALRRQDNVPGPNDPASAAAQLASASMLQLKLSSGTAWSAGRGGLAARGLGLADSRLAPRLTGIESILANPLVALVPENRFVSASTPLTGAWSGRVAVVRGKGCDPTCADINLLELTHQGRRHAVNLSMGAMKEHGAVNGQAGDTDATGVAPQTRTTGLTLSAAWALDGEWLVAAAYSVARTSAQWSDVTPGRVVSNGYGMGLLKTDTWRAGDRLSLTLHAPLSARSGALVIHGDEVGPGMFANGTHAIPLKPEAREWTAETRYTTRLSADSAVTAAAAYRQNPDHDADATSQMAVGVRYNRSF